MAGIDKIYATSYKQYKEFHDWCIIFQSLCYRETNLDLLQYFYYTEQEVIDYIGIKGHIPYGFPITNFPCSVDKWLLKRCPIKWIREYMIYIQHIKEPKLKEIELVDVKLIK